MHSKVPRFLHKSKLRCRHALFNDKAGMMEHCIGLGASLQCVANPGPWGHGQERHCLADGRTEAGQRLRRTQCWLTLAPRRAEGYESSLWPEARFQLFSRSRLFRAETVDALWRLLYYLASASECSTVRSSNLHPVHVHAAVAPQATWATHAKVGKRLQRGVRGKGLQEMAPGKAC